MDTVRMEKFQAMKGYKRRRKSFLRRLVHYIRTTVFFGLFLSSPLWFPKVKYSFNYAIFVVLPTFHAAVLAPKCLFFLFNIIIVFLLLNQSKRSRSTSLTQDVYDEYVEKSKMLRKKMSSGVIECTGTAPPREEKLLVVDAADSPVTMPCQEKDGEVEGSSGDEEENGVEDEEEEEESGPIPVDELHRRANDFIARVNEQIRVEARMFGT